MAKTFCSPSHTSKIRNSRLDEMNRKTHCSPFPWIPLIGRSVVCNWLQTVRNLRCDFFFFLIKRYNSVSLEGKGKGMHQFSSVRSLSRVWLFATLWIAAHQASLSITNSWSSLRLTSIESVMPSSHLTLCRPLLLPPIPPSIRGFSNESTLRMRWPKL